MKIIIKEGQFDKIVNHIFEDSNKSSPDEIYNKYYSDIDRNDFDEIIEADPKTVSGVKIGKYAKLLLDMYRRNKLLIEDLPKATDYLSLVYKYNRSIPNTVKTLADIYNLIEDKIIKMDSSLDEVLEQLDSGKDYDLLFESFNWIVFIPITEKGASYLGVNTEWCTAWREYCRNPAYRNRRNFFNQYNKDGDLYIIINKNDNDEKYQIHFQSQQFMDRDDNEFDMFDLLNINDDLVPIFEKIGDHIIKEYIKNGSTGTLDLYATNIKTLGNIEKIGRSLYLMGCTSLTSLGELEKVGGTLYLHGCTSLTSLGNIKTVGDKLNLLFCSSLTSLGDLESVGGHLQLSGCKSLTSLGSLEKVGGKITIKNTPLENMYKSGKLEKMYPQFKGKFFI